MTRKLTAQDLADAITTLAEDTREATMRELMEEFIDFARSSQTDSDEVAGLWAAAEFIGANYSNELTAHFNKYADPDRQI